MNFRVYPIILILSCFLSVANGGDKTVDEAVAAQPESRRITTGQSAVLGVVEGLTEYLPVSSTGHLILARHAMDLSEFTDTPGPLGPRIEMVPAVDAFEIVIQLGAILAVIGLYWEYILSMVKGIFGKDRKGLRLFGLLVTSVVPAAVFGLLLHKPIKEYLFGPITVSMALIVGGVAMLVADYCYNRFGKDRKPVRHIELMTFRQALIIGLAQCLAMWPGTSRSMVTIVAAILVGVDMASAAKYSFLLALPTLGAATVYEGIQSYDVLLESIGAWGLVVGLVVSGVVAAAAVKLFVKWLTRHGLWPFGIYRIILGAAVLWYFRGMIF